MRNHKMFNFIVLSIFLCSCSSPKSGDGQNKHVVERAAFTTMNVDNTPNMVQILFQTSMGDIVIALYDETPLHKANMIKLVKENYYDGVLFHRVIDEFMIQTGDPNSKNAKAGVPLGMGGPGYTIPAEIKPNFFHKRGAVAAARMGDNVNPEKASSGSQFYIVERGPFSRGEIDDMKMGGLRLTQTQIDIYTTLGGTPHLDGAYTVFGEVVTGMDIVEKISEQPVDERDRPKEDIMIVKASIYKNDPNSTK